ncbi:hypothetical protein PHET_07162 [Paragonimus heterotremus]|uniref:Uncharacterized protein n=1 Tax=Paragonimus heterotremus TaxID=100268 RepID=A0A8J4SMX6_9TREM|nr:hypothetical protein PHET_07162 [Paragonimus heterotremus]
MMSHCASVQYRAINIEEHEAAESDSADPDKRISVIDTDKAILPNNEPHDHPEKASVTTRPTKSVAARDVQSHLHRSKRPRTEEDDPITKGTTTTGREGGATEEMQVE